MDIGCRNGKVENLVLIDETIDGDVECLKGIRYNLLNKLLKSHTRVNSIEKIKTMCHIIVKFPSISFFVFRRNFRQNLDSFR